MRMPGCSGATQKNGLCWDVHGKGWLAVLSWRQSSREDGLAATRGCSPQAAPLVLQGPGPQGNGGATPSLFFLLLFFVVVELLSRKVYSRISSK